MTKAMAADRGRVELPFKEWPEADRRAWDGLFVAGDVLDAAGAGRHWAAATRETNRHHYGRWLAWLKQSGELDHDALPWERATPDRVRRYAEDLLEAVAPRTVASILIGLKVVLKAMHPEGDWRWLMDLTNRVNTWAEPAVDRSAQTIPIEHIHNACLGELDRLLQTPLTRRLDRVAYRDTLIVLLLSAAPVRLRNLAMIEIGTHLTLDEDRATLRFTESETKNRQRLTHPLPRHVRPYLQHYLDRVRPSFGPADGCHRLWLGFEGGPLTRAFDLRPHHSRHRAPARREDQPAQLPRLRRHQPRQPLRRRGPPRRAPPRPPLLLHHRAPLHPRAAARGEPQGPCYARRHPSQSRSKGIARMNEAARAQQIDDACRIAERLRDQGWRKVSIAITRGGTYRIEAEAGEGGPARHEFRTGRK